MSTTPEPMTGVSDVAVEVAAPHLDIAISPDESVMEFQERQARAALGAAAPLLVADAVAERDAARAELAGVVAAVEAVCDEAERRDAESLSVQSVRAHQEQTYGPRSGPWPSNVWTTDLRTALASTGAGEALARARERAWDEAVASLIYDDGTPVEIIRAVNPYRTTEKECGDE